MELLLTLCNKTYKVHRANTRKVKNFIRSFGNKAKTDALDAKALALYGYERKEHLEIFTPLSQNAVNLYAFVQHRKDLKQMLVAEKNRAQSPQSSLIKASCADMIKILCQKINDITQEIESLMGL